MNKPPEKGSDKSRDEFIKLIAAKEKLKLAARRGEQQSVWVGFIKYGTIGWSVALPTLAGVACGIWLDKNYPAPHSWTLSLMALGLFTGCAAAWHWVESEEMKIKKDDEKKKAEDKKYE